VNTVVTFGFTYWEIMYYVLLWCFCLPAVLIVYYITNLFVRLLGYNVRPFPGGRLNRIINWSLRLFIRLAQKIGLGKYPLLRALMKEFRRRSIQSQGQRSTVEL
ncbi:MAG: hypothetical protein M3Z24_03400, partial [Chloroflexota bacterium]|nr:hypothetical protein [Chloroflexota bacterium]